MTTQHRVILSKAAPAPAGAYEQAIAQSGFVFTSGIVGRNAATDTVPENFRLEVRQALANLDAVLLAAGASKDTVVKTLCYLKNIDDFTIFDEEYAAYFTELLPARSTIGVDLAGGYRFEIEAVAANVGS